MLPTFTVSVTEIESPGLALVADIVRCVVIADEVE
jgi:hypothetical protein